MQGSFIAQHYKGFYVFSIVLSLSGARRAALRGQDDAGPSGLTARLSRFPGNALARKYQDDQDYQDDHDLGGSK
jgi:hypothetical protein